ncbi:multidrug resistance protein 3 [Janthinobacterium sp. HH103]|uniref:MDR family MFS transporter n=1 Tax=unclassified Janthinobacterium TaxID=2610881 RepID=UPI000893393D|nr:MULTISPECIES: MDR family MFS transporter [unclassified Janthinobacterium]OEZ65519.1 multidrug resistance protein 3 [Janthinobacterium sp. HH100]OEZ67362.1 multidrug resistance protein 3 [Janthinobacterium sp. HH103]QOU72483.1 Multidrug resistance protein 3 [Janthinobacterium sp. HH102]
MSGHDHAAGADKGAAKPVTEREVRAIYLGLMAVLGLGALDQSIVATALPRIVDDLGGMAHLSWVVTAYVLASTATMPLYGKLADQYGRRPMIFTALLTFLLGSVLCGLAQNMTELIIFRAIQGLGAGGFMPLAQIIIGDIVPPAERGKRQGMVPVVFAVTSVLGPVLGGVITDALSWHWIFYVNLPVDIAAFYIIARAVRKPVRTHAHRIDYLGSALLTGAVTAALLVLALGGTEWPWDSLAIKVCGGIAVLLGAWLAFHVGRVDEPVLPPDLFENRTFNIASLVMAMTFMGLMGASVFFPLFFQLVMGTSPAESGVMTVAMMVGLVASSMFNGRVLSRSGKYKMVQVAGLAVALLAFAVLAWAMETSRGYWIIEPAIFFLGTGLGLVMPNMTIAVQNALPLARRGVGTAMLAFFRSLGGLLGVTASGAILAHQLHQHGVEAVSALGAHAAVQTVEVYRHAIASVFGAGAVLLVGLVFLLFLPELPLEGHPATLKPKTDQ